MFELRLFEKFKKGIVKVGGSVFSEGGSLWCILPVRHKLSVPYCFNNHGFPSVVSVTHKLSVPYCFNNHGFPSVVSVTHNCL